VPLLFIAWNVFFLKFILAFLQVKPIAVPGVDIGAFDIMNRSDITPREKEIIHELLTGSTVSAIATKLFISGHTAKTHVKNIYQKLEVKNRVELMNLITAQQESYSQKNRPQTPPSPLF
jgi:DNA-binding CsgD family transcriptional regulator